MVWQGWSIKEIKITYVELIKHSVKLTILREPQFPLATISRNINSEDVHRMTHVFHLK